MYASLCVEYNGAQHYRPVDYFGGIEGFKTIQESDKFKKEYCERNNIKLLEIHFKDYKNIEAILTKQLL